MHCQRSNARSSKPPPPPTHPLSPPTRPQLDPTAALRTLDMGPPADQADAARAFRAFWGDRAELRRFRDGAIAEAVVWEGGGAADRHLIVDRWSRGLGGAAGGRAAAGGGTLWCAHAHGLLGSL